MSESANTQGTGQLFVVSAPSGAGKTSLVRALIESSPAIGVAVSHTTRAKRPEEIDGTNYHFITPGQFRQMADNAEFLEWATVFGHLYGTSTEAVSQVLGAGKHLILEIDWQGAAQVRQKIPGTQSVFIFPPSLKSLRERLQNRAQDDEETVETRMAAAFEELSHWQEFDYLIVNDDFDTALSELKSVIEGTGLQYRRESRSEELAALIRDLLPQT